MNHPRHTQRLMGMDAAAEDRFATFAAASVPALLRLAYVVTGDGGHAEDVVQTALAKAYAGWRRVERAGNPEAYVRRMVVNAAVDLHRRRSRRAPETLGAVIELPAAVDVSDSVVSAALVRSLLLSLPPRQRAVMALRFLLDLTEAATAAELGITVGAVKSHTSKALVRLRSAHELVAAPAKEDGRAHQ